jgi:regulatory protein
MQITAIEPQAKNPQRVNIYLNGEFAFGLAAIVAAWLKVGQEISEEKAASLKAEDEHEVTYQKALHFIDYRPRSAAEVRQNLIKKGIAEELVQDTIERLQRTGLLNDEAFARSWVENRNAFRPRSRTALKMELRRKGLDDETIQNALSEQADEESVALEAARKYSRRLAGLDWPTFRQKLGNFLARRGFSYTTLAPVVSKVWEEIQTADAGRKTENKE